jgi:hypothetical protein
MDPAEHGAPPDRADYYLWHPVVSADGAELRCTFDVTVAGARSLNKGDAALCAQFARNLGLPVDEVLDWRLDRFCTPYYSDYPSSDDWRERFPLAWRMTLRAKATDADRYLGPGPHRAVGVDPTWYRSPEFQQPDNEVCEVIADRVVAGQDPSIGERLHGELRRAQSGREVTWRRLPVSGGILHQFRIALGRLDVPTEHDRVDDAMAACEELGLTTDCRRTFLHVVDLAESS